MGMNSFYASKQEKPPTGNGVAITPLVIKDLQDRSAAGEKKYGTVLKSENGRNPLIDVYQEALDLVMYLRQAIEEDQGK